jgi:Flp pilus assembly protein TadB
MYKRTIEIEDVLPDFLQLTAANINAGMTIDKALWYAVRPKFGILAKEIEEVAKNTMTGEDLKKSLKEFSDRYNSKTLERSINLLLEGLESGGQMADLLNKIAINIKDGKILKKEMSADVTTYVIFIAFACIVGAPALLGLSTNLLIVIQTMVGGIDISTQIGSASFIDLNANAIALNDFRIFVFIMLFITSLFSSFIISTIKKGNIKEGIRYIPVFIISTLALYYLSYYIISIFTSSLV